MIKISAGPKLIQYANTVGADVSEVVSWVSGYVNGPWSKSLEPYIEKTEKERLKSIQENIEMMLNLSLANQIKHDIVTERIQQAEEIKNVCECPF